MRERSGPEGAGVLIGEKLWIEDFGFLPMGFVARVSAEVACVAFDTRFSGILVRTIKRYLCKHFL